MLVVHSGVRTVPRREPLSGASASFLQHIERKGFLFVEQRAAGGPGKA
jgi:hypothetical protein